MRGGRLGGPLELGANPPASPLELISRQQWGTGFRPVLLGGSVALTAVRVELKRSSATLSATFALDLLDEMNCEEQSRGGF